MGAGGRDSPRLPGVFSFAWDFDNPADARAVESLIEPVVQAAQPVDFVELNAPQAVRLAREGGADRMDHKRSKRDVEWARAHVVAMERRARFSSRLYPATGEDDWPLPQYRHLRLDNSHADPLVTASRIVAELGLPRSGPTG